MTTKNEFNFITTRLALEKAVRELPKQMAEIVKDDSVTNIERGSFYGKPYVPRKGSYDHPILNDTGNLLNAVKTSIQTGNKAGRDSFDIKVMNTYGLFHNEGTTKLPQRQFMGESRTQISKITKFIDDIIIDIFEKK